MTLPKKSISKLLFAVTFICMISLSFGQTKAEQIDKLLNLYEEYGQLNGSVLVSDNGEVIYKKGFGMANMEWDIPNTPNTKFRLASVTKQFTGMLILQLVAEGKLDLHKPISTYLPDYNKANGDKVTIDHLLTHSSGIPNYTSFPGFMQNEIREPYTPTEFIKKFEDKDLEFTPGERFNYSNSGYFLLGVLVEKVTGKTYEQMMQDYIFKPLNMKDSGYDHFDKILKNRATGYEKNGKTYVNSRYLDMSIPYAAGSLYSTVEDLYLWDQALYTTKLLPQKYMDIYFTPHFKQPQGSYAYGIGIGEDKIGNTEDEIDVNTHSGGINGFNTNISRSPSKKDLIVVLNNAGGAPLNAITRAIRGILYNKPYDLPKKSIANELLETINNKGLEKGLAFYNANKDAVNYKVDEGDMNQIGYELMGSEKLKEAIQVFKLNIEAFPEAFNAYDSYAEALMTLGDNEGAIKNYRKSIELNPANQNGIDMLKKLGVDTSDMVKDVIVPEVLLESYIGNYELMPGFILSITKEDSKLMAQATGQPKFEVFAKSNNIFYFKVVVAEITFNTNEKGVVDTLTLVQGGQTLTGKRVPK